MTANLVFSLGFFIFLYKFVPLFLATRLGKAVPALSGRFATNMTDGVIRMAIFLAFLFLISRMKEIRRVFEYHGAEHKVVFNFESRQPLTVDNAQKFVTFHPRCGTSFLLVVMVISMIVYALLPFDSFLAKFLATHRAAAPDHRPKLRIDPLRRQAPGHCDGPAYRARPVAAAHHDASRPTIAKSPLRSMLWKARWRSKPSRAANW